MPVFRRAYRPPRVGRALPYRRGPRDRFAGPSLMRGLPTRTRRPSARPFTPFSSSRLRAAQAARPARFADRFRSPAPIASWLLDRRLPSALPVPARLPRSFNGAFLEG